MKTVQYGQKLWIKGKKTDLELCLFCQLLLKAAESMFLTGVVCWVTY